MTDKVYRSEREGSQRHDAPGMAELANELEDQLDEARARIDELERQLKLVTRERDTAVAVSAKHAIARVGLEEKLAEAETRYGQRVVEMNSLRRHNEILAAASKEARQVARDYRSGILRLDWYEWHEETVLKDDAETVAKYPWLEE